MNLERFQYDSVQGLSLVIEKHGSHDQKTHGNWAHGGGMVDGLINRLGEKETPGFSIRIKTKKAPKSGYMVSDEGAEKVIPSKDFFSSREASKKYIKDYIKANSDALSQRGAYLGGWHERESGKVFLDVSRRYDSRKDAVYALFDNKQISAYDVENDSYIYAKDEVDDRTRKATGEQSSVGGSSETSQSNDGRGIGQVRRRDSGSNTGQPLRHICLGRAGLVNKHLEGQHDQRTHGNWAGDRYPEDSVKSARDGALEYVYKKGLKYDQTIDYTKVVANRERAARIADLYEKLPKKDVEAIDEYEALASEVEEQFDFMTKNLGIKVEFVPEDPYKTSKEMFADVSKGTLKVLQTASTGAHPLFSNEQNDKFRAVHDYFGHAATGRGFGQDGEESAWVHHSQMFTEKARGALTTETRGQNSFFNNRGRQFADQKVALLPEEFWKVPTTFAKGIFIRFQAGLRPVLKHLPGQHEQKDHGLWADYIEEQAQGIKEVQDIGPSKEDILNWINSQTAPDPTEQQIRLWVDNNSALQDRINELVDEQVEATRVEFIEQEMNLIQREKNREVTELELQELEGIADAQTEQWADSQRETITQNYISDMYSDIVDDMRDSGELEGGEFDADAAVSWFSEVYDIEHTGKNENGEEIYLESRVEAADYEDGRILIQGQVYDKDGNVVSEGPGFVRSWYLEDGKLVQEHDYFRLQEEYRGTGFGKVFVDRSENWATQAGIEKIKVGTAWDGARHWARMGYDFDPKQSKKDLLIIHDSYRKLVMSEEISSADRADFEKLMERAVPAYASKKTTDSFKISQFTMDDIPEIKNNPNYPTPAEFAMVGYARKGGFGGGWAGKTILADLRLHYEKVLTPEGRTIPQGPIDRDGDGLVYDGTARERPATGGEVK